MKKPFPSSLLIVMWSSVKVLPMSLDQVSMSAHVEGIQGEPLSMLALHALCKSYPGSQGDKF